MRSCIENLNKLSSLEFELCKMSSPFFYEINNCVPFYNKIKENQKKENERNERNEEFERIEENEESNLSYESNENNYKEREEIEREEYEENEENYDSENEKKKRRKFDKEEKEEKEEEEKEVNESKVNNNQNNNTTTTSSLSSNSTSNLTSNLRDIKTKICVVEMDCLEASALLSMFQTDGNDRPLVLNMANSYNCGGGFSGIYGSQEEYIFRNSSLVASLWPHRRRDDNRWEEGRHLFPHRDELIYYPFTNCGGAYSPHVIVFNFPHICSVISLAAQDLRQGRIYNGKSPGFNYQLAKENLRSLFHIAAEYQHTTLVLGAIGCGAFKNPPTEVARAFSELLQTEFSNVFKYVIFAIIKSTDNLEAFESYFGRKVDLQRILSQN